MHQFTAAEALMLSEALRGAAASAQAATMEAASSQDPQLRQFLQSEAQRHRQSAQKIQQMLGAAPH